MNDTNLRTCPGCGWVHYGVSRKKAEDMVAKFNEFYDSAPIEMLDHFGRRARIASYECCNHCGTPAEDMRPTTQEEIPRGSTLSPIIVGC
jgi:hypothetical protein